MTLVFYRCDLKVAEMIVCRKDEFIRRAVPSALPYEAWREGNDSSWNPLTTYPAIERSASEPREGWTGAIPSGYSVIHSQYSR